VNDWPNGNPADCRQAWCPSEIVIDISKDTRITRSDAEKRKEKAAQNAAFGNFRDT